MSLTYSNPILYLFAAFALIFLGIVFPSYQKNRKYRLPPRVPGIPIFGNTFQLPPAMQGEHCKKLAEKYGEMFTMKFGGSTWVFLNSSRVVTDLLERRSAIYCSRPPFPMTQDIVSDGGRMVLMPYNERWRSLRKVMHQILSSRQTKIFQPFQEIESKTLLWNYLKNPEKWYRANGQYANSVIMSVVFGRRTDMSDPQTTELFGTIDEFLELQQPGATLVDGFPVLAKLPKFLQWWRPKGERIRERTVRTYKHQFEILQSAIKAGTQRPCFMTEFLEDSEKLGYDENQKYFTAGTLLEAGSDTTRVSLGQMIAAAATYPDWVVRAREELDRVCGANAERLPDWQDEDDLPYMKAVVKESFRWRPITAEIGAPTSLIQDDAYEDYVFPAGTVFTWNAWAISLSENEYKDAKRFWPERFLNGDLDNPLKGQWGFGPGRRVCVGWHVGQQNTFIAAARLLYCFNFTEDPSEPIDTFRIPQVTKGKPQFKVIVSLRSPEHGKLIERDCYEAAHSL